MVEALGTLYRESSADLSGLCSANAAPPIDGITSEMLI